MKMTEEKGCVLREICTFLDPVHNWHGRCYEVSTKSTQEYQPYPPCCPRVLQQFFALLFKHARHARSSINRFNEFGLLLVADVMIVTVPFGHGFPSEATRGSIPTVAVDSQHLEQLQLQ